jgi:hypothetical protein
MNMEIESKASSKTYVSIVNEDSQSLITELDDDSFPEILVKKTYL